MRVVYWVLKDRIEGKEDGVSLELCLKWFPACLALLALVSSRTASTLIIRFVG